MDQLGDLGDPAPSSNAPLKRFDYVPPDTTVFSGDLGVFFKRNTVSKQPVYKEVRFEER